MDLSPRAKYFDHLFRVWLEPILGLQNFVIFPKLYIRFLRDWSRYRSIPNAEPLRFLDSYPRLFDSTTVTPFDSHYFYQSVWAFRDILNSGVTHHVDIGSSISLVGLLSLITKVTFVDIRPLMAQIASLECVQGSILALPFENGSIISLSCLHVAEHIGLGRYGDPLDPQGTKKAARELTRVLAAGGQLYFSLPIGRPRVCFNAHRIHAPEQILDYFADLHLVEFSVVKDDGKLYMECELSSVATANYACGLFHFTK